MSGKIIMKINTRSVSIKGYRSKKHKFELETAEISGYTFITIKKNGNPILKCSPSEYIKFKKLFNND